MFVYVFIFATGSLKSQYTVNYSNKLTDVFISVNRWHVFHLLGLRAQK